MKFQHKEQIQKFQSMRPDIINNWNNLKDPYLLLTIFRVMIGYEGWPPANEVFRAAYNIVSYACEVYYRERPLSETHQNYIRIALAACNDFLYGKINQLVLTKIVEDNVIPVTDNEYSRAADSIYCFTEFVDLKKNINDILDREYLQGIYIITIKSLMELKKILKLDAEGIKIFIKEYVGIIKKSVPSMVKI